VRQKLLDRLLLQSRLLLRGLLLRRMLPVRPLRQTLSEGGCLLRITVRRVRERNVARVALEGLRAEGCLGIKVALRVAQEGLWAEGNPGDKSYLVDEAY